MISTSSVMKKVATKGPTKALMMSLSSFLNTYLYYMNEAKIRLSQKEMELVNDTAVILTKNVVLQKVLQLLGDVLEKQQAFLQNNRMDLPPEITRSSPKISRGENYRGLPYFVLDFPKCFEKDDIFAVRTMFWWGHFFSITLHLSGRFKEMFEQKIITATDALRENNFYYCINDEAWEHHFEEDNYISLRNETDTVFKTAMKDKTFIKLAQKISLHQWNDADELLTESFKRIMKILAG